MSIRFCNGNSVASSSGSSSNASKIKCKGRNQNLLKNLKKVNAGNGNSEKGNGNEGSGESNGEKKNDEEKQQGLMQFEEIKDSIGKGN